MAYKLKVKDHLSLGFSHVKGILFSSVSPSVKWISPRVYVFQKLDNDLVNFSVVVNTMAKSTLQKGTVYCHLAGHRSLLRGVRAGAQGMG